MSRAIRPEVRARLVLPVAYGFACAALIAALLCGPPAAAQALEQLPAKPYDPSWRSIDGVDPTMDCSLLPENGPDPYVIGMPAALAAAERRELALGGFGTMLNRADREPSPAYIPALKRITDQYRCASYDIKVALAAIEAAGEPRAYFLDLVRNWRYNDHLAAAAMDALAIRGDSAAYVPLRDIILGVPQKGRFGVNLTSEFNIYVQGLWSWRFYRNLPIPQQINVGASLIAGEATQGGVFRGVRGDSVGELENYNGSSLHAIPRRLLRDLARTYPSAVEASLRAYADTARVKLLARGVTAAQVPLYLTIIERNGRETAFPSTAPPLPPAVASAVLAPAACTEERNGVLTAVFSYRSAEPTTVRVGYGPGNALAGAQGAIPPEVFFPDTQPGAPGRSFRVGLPTGTSVTWTLLGRTVTASSASPRCGAPTVPLCAGRPATVYVADGRVVGGPLAGTPFAGRLVGTATADVIVGTDAADAILGLAGDDTLCGGTGDDALDAGTGTDTSDGGPGADGCDASETATACEGAIPALTDVRPVLECVAADGAGFVAYFGYENKMTRAGRVAYGANNRITPSTLDRAQPDLFGLPGVVATRPGRTPFYPGSAFTVRFTAGQTVVWKLFTRTSTASSGSARCPVP